MSVVFPEPGRPVMSRFPVTAAFRLPGLDPWAADRAERWSLPIGIGDGVCEVHNTLGVLTVGEPGRVCPSSCTASTMARRPEDLCILRQTVERLSEAVEGDHGVPPACKPEDEIHSRKIEIDVGDSQHPVVAGSSPLRARGTRASPWHHTGCGRCSTRLQEARSSSRSLRSGRRSPSSGSSSIVISAGLTFPDRDKDDTHGCIPVQGIAGWEFGGYRSGRRKPGGKSQPVGSPGRQPPSADSDLRVHPGAGFQQNPPDRSGKWMDMPSRRITPDHRFFITTEHVLSPAQMPLRTSGRNSGSGPV